MTPPASTPTLRDASCADDYDPNSMPVDKARALITRFLTPLTSTERVPVRSALGRVLAEDVISPINVPAHDNSAMDGYALLISSRQWMCHSLLLARHSPANLTSARCRRMRPCAS